MCRRKNGDRYRGGYRINDGSRYGERFKGYRDSCRDRYKGQATAARWPGPGAECQDLGRVAKGRTIEHKNNRLGRNNLCHNN